MDYFGHCQAIVVFYYKEEGYFRTLKTGLKILKAQNTLCSSLSPSLCWKRWICPASRAVRQPQRKPCPTTTCCGEQPRPLHTRPHAKAAGAWVEHTLPQYLMCVLEGEEPAGASPPPCLQQRAGASGLPTWRAWRCLRGWGADENQLLCRQL